MRQIISFKALLTSAILVHAGLTMADTLRIEPFQAPTWIEGREVLLQLSATGGTPPYTFSITGVSPPSRYVDVHSITADGMLSTKFVDPDSTNGCSGGSSQPRTSISVSDAVGSTAGYTIAGSSLIYPPKPTTVVWTYSQRSGKYSAEVNFSCYFSGAVQPIKIEIDPASALPSPVSIAHQSDVSYNFESSSPVAFNLDIQYTLGATPAPLNGKVRYSFMADPSIPLPAATSSVPVNSWQGLLMLSLVIGGFAWASRRRLG